MFDDKINRATEPETSICVRYNEEFPCQNDLTKFYIFSDLFAPGGPLETASFHELDKATLGRFHAWYDQILYGNYIPGKSIPTWDYATEEEISRWGDFRDLPQLSAA